MMGKNKKSIEEVEKDIKKILEEIENKKNSKFLWYIKKLTDEIELPTLVRAKSRGIAEGQFITEEELLDLVYDWTNEAKIILTLQKREKERIKKNNNRDIEYHYIFSGTINEESISLYCYENVKQKNKNGKYKIERFKSEFIATKTNLKGYNIDDTYVEELVAREIDKFIEDNKWAIKILRWREKEIAQALIREINYHLNECKKEFLVFLNHFDYEVLAFWVKLKTIDEIAELKEIKLGVFKTEEFIDNKDIGISWFVYE